MALYVDRSLKASILKDLDSKLVLLSGPRQVGKTTLSRSLFSPRSYEYFNYDAARDRKVLSEQAWRRDAELIVLDELHKMKRWKSWLKGIFDTEGIRPRILVTGSAQLESFKRGGESLAGRFLPHRLHPLSIVEASSQLNAAEALTRLLRVGGFPEPFFKGSEAEANRWRRTHLDRILREDLLDLEQVRDIKSIEILVELLSERVGTPISFSSLANDLQVSPHTVKRWISLLENLYVIFMIRPYTRGIARTILKEPKVYFYDTGRVVDDSGARLENVVACALHKRQHFLQDVHGISAGLHYIRDKQKREVDFLTTQGTKPEYIIEVKVSDPDTAPGLKHYSVQIPAAQSIQLVMNLTRELRQGHVQIRRVASWLSQLET